MAKKAKSEIDIGVAVMRMAIATAEIIRVARRQKNYSVSDDLIEALRFFGISFHKGRNGICWIDFEDGTKIYEYKED